MDLVLGQTAVLDQPLVALLQVPGGHVQLLVHLGVLVVHLTQQLHLFAQVLGQNTGVLKIYLINWRFGFQEKESAKSLLFKYQEFRYVVLSNYVSEQYQRLGLVDHFKTVHSKPFNSK